MEKILHGFDGSWTPGKEPFNSETFSVGVFPILKKSSGKGTKRGKVLVRVRGLTSDPEPVYTKAREIIDLLDAGRYTDPKTVRIK